MQIGTTAYKDKEKILKTMPILAKGEAIEVTNQIAKFFCEKLKEFDKAPTKEPTNEENKQKE